jgi:hypothetical protein
VLIAAAFCMYNRYVDGLATWTPVDPVFYDEMGRRAREGYDYTMPRWVSLEEHEYMVDYFAAGMPSLMVEEPADSDGARVGALLKDAGHRTRRRY